MAALRDSTAAVLVIYRLPRPLADTVAALARCVRMVVLVDNSAHGHDELPALAEAHGAHLIRAGNVGALAGAYNRALAHLATAPEPPQQVVFVDDDSDVTALATMLADPGTAELLTRPDTAAVCPAYRDRATGLRGKYIHLARFRFSYMPRQFDDVRAVAFVINSLSIWRWSALQRIGAFSEPLAVDHVDTEYCLRARRLGLAIYVNGRHEFAHSIGHRRRFRLLGREMQAGGHGPERRYLIARNTTWLARTWAWREPAFGFLCLARLAYEAVGILAAEEQRAAKLGALLRGVVSGLRMPRARLAAG